MNEIVDSPFGNRTANESAGARQLQARENTEVMAMAMMAKRFPRDQVVACDRIRNAFTRVTLAEKAQYQYARGGTDIIGPSIRAAEAMSQQWGNLSNGWREVARTVGPDGVGLSEVEAFCIDYETVSREAIQFYVRHWRDTKKGGYALKDERDIYELCANQAQRRKRACILAQLPGDVVEMAMDQASVTLKTSADTSTEAMARLVTAFAEFGVTKEQIEARIQRRLDAIQPAQVVGLRRIYASLRDEMSQASDWFKVDDGETTATGLDAVRAAAAAAAATPPVDGKPKRAKAAPKPAPDPETGEVPPPASGPTLGDAAAAVASMTGEGPVDVLAAAVKRAGGFDEAAFCRRLQACRDVDTLDVMIDELRDMPAGDMLERIREVYQTHRAAIA